MNTIVAKRGNTLSFVGQFKLDGVAHPGTGVTISSTARPIEKPNVRTTASGYTFVVTNPNQLWNATCQWIDESLGTFRVTFTDEQTLQWGDSVGFDVKFAGPLVGVINSKPIRVNLEDVFT